MASRIVARYISRRFSSGGKILSEEEKAVENVYIKKTEQEKLEKLARKGPAAATAEATAAASAAKPGEPAAAAAAAGAEKTNSSERISTDSKRNYAVAVGAVSVAAAFGWWYLSPKPKISEEIAD